MTERVRGYDDREEGVVSVNDVLERFRTIALGVTAREAEVVDAEYQWPEATMNAIKEEGLAGLVVPSRYGGLGMGLRAQAEACEILGRECASAGLAFGMHCVAAAVIASKATLNQGERYLEPIARGEHITTLALSEPGTGVYFYYPETQMVRMKDGYVLNGTKSFVTNGGHADSYVVSTVSADPDAPPGHFSCVMIANDAPGLTWGEPWRGLGMRGNSSRSASIDNVSVPTSELLGDEGDQVWYVFHVVAPYFLVAMAGTYLGIAESALDVAVERLKKRRYSHTGTALAHIDVMQYKLGHVWAKVHRTRQLVLWAADEGDRLGPLTLPALCAAKAEVAPCVVETVNDCMTLVGGSAYRDGSRLGRLLRDARAADVMAPTTDILYTWCGRAVLEEPLLGED
ncbi:MAG: acyl-CoA dehydrogenase family protein [Actinomycetota bacterium]